MFLRRQRQRLQGATVRATFTGAIRPHMEYASQVWSGGPTQSLQRLQDSFSKRRGIHLPPLQHRFDYHSLVLLYRMRSSLASPYLCSLLPPQASATTEYSFRKSGYHNDSSSNKKIIHIVELCPTVDGPLVHTFQGSPAVQYVVQVQNPTRNPFDMLTIAFFTLQMISFFVYLFKFFSICLFSSFVFPFI